MSQQGWDLKPFYLSEVSDKNFPVKKQVSNIDMPPDDVLPGEDHGEAGVLPGDPQGGNQFHVIGDGRPDGDVPPPQCRAASVPFQVSVGIIVPASGLLQSDSSFVTAADSGSWAAGIR